MTRFIHIPIRACCERNRIDEYAHWLRSTQLSEADDSFGLALRVSSAGKQSFKQHSRPVATQKSAVPHTAAGEANKGSGTESLLADACDKQACRPRPAPCPAYQP